MAAVRSENTDPELQVRKVLHKLGYRYRLHVRNLPGTPDIVFPRRRKVILVHGCFWHMHNCRKGKSIPATNSEFWSRKRHNTVKRDKRDIKALQNLGWSVLTIWECAVGKSTTEAKLTQYLTHAKSK